MKYMQNGVWIGVLLISIVSCCYGMEKNSTLPHKVVTSRELVLDFKGGVIHSQDQNGDVSINATNVTNLSSVLLTANNKGLFGFKILARRNTDPYYLKVQFTSAKILSLSSDDIRKTKYFETLTLNENNTVTVEAHGSTVLKEFLRDLNESPSCEELSSLEDTK